MSKLYIPLSAKRVEYTPPSLFKAGKKSPCFVLREPTGDETTALGQELYRRGVVPISQATTRATLIDELYNLYDEDVADEKATILEEWWHFDEIHQADIAIWEETERQRLEDIANGGPQKEQAEMPRYTGSARTKARGQLILDEVSNLSLRLKDVGLRQNNYEYFQRRMTCRLYICDWRGLKVKPEFDTADAAALTEECLDQMFDEIGPKARRELEARISASFVLTEEERKNSDLPVESGQEATGLQALKGASESSAGKSTESNTGQTQGDGSAPITEE